ncbi:MAG: hypothetical protein GWN62_13865, partial [Aliifodinibius sp.]|nr:hypothetical protein [Fodinibius sp.]
MLQQFKTQADIEKVDIKKLSDKELEEMLVQLDIAQARDDAIWGVYNFRPHNKQKEFLYAKDKTGDVPYIRLVTSGNKWGKTHSGVAENLAHMVGFRPWLKKDDPNYIVRHGGKKIAVPNRGLVIGETIT